MKWRKHLAVYCEDLKHRTMGNMPWGWGPLVWEILTFPDVFKPKVQA